MVVAAGCLGGSSEETEHVIPEEYLSLANPVQASSASVAAGEKLYTGNCERCHGPDGEGDGPEAMMMDPRPVDLHHDHVQENTDGGIFYVISFGVRGTQMPPFNSLSEDDRWHIVNYVRTFESDEGVHSEGDTH